MEETVEANPGPKGLASSCGLVSIGSPEGSAMVAKRALECGLGIDMILRQEFPSKSKCAVFVGRIVLIYFALRVKARSACVQNILTFVS